jgi:hypothetical protein
VYATGTYIPTDELICDIGTAAHGDWTSGVNGYRPYALVGVMSMPSGGAIALDCQGGPFDKFPGLMTDNRLVAIAVDAVN